MVRSAVKTAVTSDASYDSHTSPLGNLKAFLDEETEAKRSLESAKSSQIVCAKVGAEGPVLDSKSSPYSDNKSRSEAGGPVLDSKSSPYSDNQSRSPYRTSPCTVS